MLSGTYGRFSNVDTLNVRLLTVIKRAQDLFLIRLFRGILSRVLENMFWRGLARGWKCQVALELKNLTTHCTNVIYTSFIIPVFDYCDTVLNCCGEGNTSSLERLQKRTTRIAIFNNYWTRLSKMSWFVSGNQMNIFAEPEGWGK